MARKISFQEVVDGLLILGVSQQDLETVRLTAYPESKVALQRLKEKARRAYKRVALELHPDRTAGDKDKTALFVLAGRALEEFVQTSVPEPLPRRPLYQSPEQERFVSSPTWQQLSQAGRFRAKQRPKQTSVEQVTRVVKMRPK